MSDSCFVAKLRHYMDLTKSEIDALSALEGGERDVAAGTVIFAEEDGNADSLFIVKEGLLHSSSLMKDGERQILLLHHPGDVMGTTSIAFTKPAATAIAAVDSVLCTFPKLRLKPIYRDHPRLAALFYSISMLENVSLCDRLRSVGRSNGEARIAVLMLDYRDRLRVTHPETKSSFDLPLTQADIADAIGMTHVHTNRLFTQMKKDGLLERRLERVELLNEVRLMDLADYTNRHDSVDKTWYPEPA